MVQSQAQARPPRAYCPGPCPDGCWVSQRREGSTTSLDNLCQGSVTVSNNFFCCWHSTSCVPVVLCLWSCHLDHKEPGSILFILSLQEFTHSSVSRLSSPSSLSLSLQERKSNPFIILVADGTLSTMSMFPSCWGGQNCTCCSRSGLIVQCCIGSMCHPLELQHLARFGSVRQVIGFSELTWKNKWMKKDRLGSTLKKPTIPT